MRRGLDVIYLPFLACVQFSSLAGAWSRRFSVVIARGKHLFPFRTEPLSPSAPMVLGGQLPGRVGRRRSLSPRAGPSGRLFAPSRRLYCGATSRPTGRLFGALCRLAPSDMPV